MALARHPAHDELHIVRTVDVVELRNAGAFRAMQRRVLLVFFVVTGARPGAMERVCRSALAGLRAATAEMESASEACSSAR
jgi:predicted Rossmann-fold nucleotide-binding protein